ncbi:bifunctional proline dehydrogenase/L-glutamate gamma-semialdehyde dehydrogenase PutA [Paraburkholderia guartelaensis]|uniref:Bifunctional protein PutA n=1 Tax=Paraburkholderia guartelaensis TaxID=2546446 RepID=A0A4R5LMA6_9BURK|nr:bifunctional proline dehydrogenase/L-glutamate gamma-semialdehyde dehydrogenase PutA [Paraburkholderia guartelaensis]TDG10999.1 bifunctional proline dehydrogenase/L-glutamate gamma-semialdehyde dehydrogenase PutA [Paraburkholderia guartelaensis]
MLSEIEVTQTGTANLSVLRQRIAEASALPEEAVVQTLMRRAQMDASTLAKAQELAARLAQGVRDARIDAGGVDLLTQEFSLDSREGIALMCLAEAMLRIPDTDTRNQLIRDKIVDADWRAHVGKSPSMFVNATAWGLLVTGKLLKQPDENALAEALTRVVRKGGEAVVRAGVAYAMRMLGKQFVTGQTIEEAIGAAKGRESGGYRYSYDMLGEAALTDEDAQTYFESYRHAIEAIGKDAQGRGPIDGPGVSVKISGLHPRYELAQRERVLAELYPRLLELAQLAKQYGIGFHLDQEESARFELTLEMLEMLCNDPSLRGWNGIGISLQAYQKRGHAVADWIVALARSTGRRINIRLVKGAYWDTEIKLAQDAGSQGYPVFTRKVHSDVSYIACAKVLLDAPDAIFPQFASHNAFTIAAVHTLAGSKDYEFQCLHGMGETVYDQVVGESKLGRPCRIYAPVGPHATLLAYLVRRLLENGANSSFVNQIVDPAVSIADIVEDPVAKAARTHGKPHAGIASPVNVLPGRVNAAAISYGNSTAFDAAVSAIRTNRISAQSLVAPLAAGVGEIESDSTHLVYGAGDTTEVVGSVSFCRPATVARAIAAAREASANWAQSSVNQRADMLERMSAELEASSMHLGALLVLENGATLAEAAEEVRTAINLCRLYALQVKADARLRSRTGLGVVASVTPVSSPLATFVGHVAASLAAGNVVVAKPSSKASLVAYEAARVFYRGGLPKDVLQLLLGAGTVVGRELLVSEEVAGVLFAGSAESARAAALLLAKRTRQPRFLAQAGSVNAMIVDSSALPEQVISDATVSAFSRAGQSASSLQLLCLQDSTAEKVLKMLKGMLSERNTGNPLSIGTDIGPLATREAKDRTEAYIERMRRLGYAVVRGNVSAEPAKGNFVAPAIIDIRDVGALAAVNARISGPVLHVVRYKTGEMDALLAALNAIGCGVQGLHTRINEAAGKLLSASNANSVCVNRAMHGTVPGMQPFGGVGACGSGPMLGGPLTLYALCASPAPAFNADAGPFAQTARAVSEKFFEFPVESAGGKLKSRQGEMARAKKSGLDRVNALFALATARSIDSGQRAALGKCKQRLDELVSHTTTLSLPALTGEENTVELLPRGQVLCTGETPAVLLEQAMAASAFGNTVLLFRSSVSDDMAQVLGAACRVVNATDVAVLLRGEVAGVKPDAVMVASNHAALSDLRVAAAESMTTLVQPGADGQYDWTQLVRERVTTVNASAAGGNTQLMVLSEDAV